MTPLLFRAPCTLSIRELRDAIRLGSANLNGQLLPLAHKQVADRVHLFTLELSQR